MNISTGDAIRFLLPAFRNSLEMKKAVDELRRAGGYRETFAAATIRLYAQMRGDELLEAYLNKLERRQK